MSPRWALARIPYRGLDGKSANCVPAYSRLEKTLCRAQQVREWRLRKHAAMHRKQSERYKTKADSSRYVLERHPHTLPLCTSSTSSKLFVASIDGSSSLAHGGKRS